MGDLNVKVCTNQGPLREVVGSHGLSSRNKPGDMWVDWCMTHYQYEHMFLHHNIHLYTWKGPGDGVRNQIDYITINNRFRNSSLQLNSYPGTDGGREHVSIVATLRMKIKKDETEKNLETS